MRPPAWSPVVVVRDARRYRREPGSCRPVSGAPRCQPSGARRWRNSRSGPESYRERGPGAPLSGGHFGLGELRMDTRERGAGIGRARDLAADDDIARSVADSLRGGCHTLLIALAGAARAHT